MDLFSNFTNYKIGLATFKNFSEPNDSLTATVPEPPRHLVLTATIFYFLIFCLGIFGNVVVIVVILGKKTMKNTVNMLLINLCVADLLVLVVCMPPTLVELHMKDVWIFGQLMCKLVPFLEFVVASASIFTIIAISIERYRVVCVPLCERKEFPMSQVIRIVFAIWILAIISSAPILPIIVYKNSQLKDGTPIKVCRIPVKKDWQKVFFISNAISIYFIPSLILVALYTKICRNLMSSSYLDNGSADHGDQCQPSKASLRVQVIKIITSITCVFFICHLPYRVVSIWLMLENESTLISLGLETYLSILYSARIVLYLNHSINPFLYNFVSPKFRNSLRSFFQQRKRTNSVHLKRKNRTTEDKKQKQTVSTRFQNNCNVYKDRLGNPDRASKDPPLNNRRKMNDFSILYRKLCDSNQSEKGRDKYYLDGKNHLPSSLSPNSSKLKVQLQTTKNGSVVAIKVVKVKSSDK